MDELLRKVKYGVLFCLQCVLCAVKIVTLPITFPLMVVTFPVVWIASMFLGWFLTGQPWDITLGEMVKSWLWTPVHA